MIEYYFSTTENVLNKSKEKIQNLLKDCFWSKEIPVEYVERFIKYSLCFGVYEKISNQLIGFGRVISDYTTYAYLCDVVIDPKYRRNGIGKNLINEIMAHPELQGLKTWALRTTENAKMIYEKKGFLVADNPETQMEMCDLHIYLKPGFKNIHKNTMAVQTPCS